MLPFSLREAFSAHPIARRVPIDFDGTSLASDLVAIGEEWWHPHAGPYHNGGWESVSLWAPRGDPFEQRSKGGSFAATPALLRASYLRDVLERFDAERNRIRLMRLLPGGRIHEHSDPMHTIDRSLVRLHVPLATSDDVVFLVAGRRVRMGVGETWHVDVRFPHAVENRGESPRVHLVMDLVRNPTLDALLTAGQPAGHGRLTGYFAKHALPTPLLRALRLGN